MSKGKLTIAILGLGRFGSSLTKELSEYGVDVIVCDTDEKKVKSILTYTKNAFVVNDNSEETLRSIGVDNCDLAVVCMGSDIAKSILTTLTVLNLGVKKVLSKATDDAQAEILKRLGADVVSPERDMAIRTAKKIVSSNVMDYLDINEEYEIAEITCPNIFVGKDIFELDVRKKYGLNVLAAVRNKKVYSDFTNGFKFDRYDNIIIFGRKDNLNKLKKEG